MTADTYTVINEGLTTWQVFTVAAFTAAAFVLLDRLWDHAVDAWFDWRERHRHEPIADASDNTPDRRFVPSVPRTVLSEDGTTETPYPEPEQVWSDEPLSVGEQP